MRMDRPDVSGRAKKPANKRIKHGHTFLFFSTKRQPRRSPRSTEGTPLRPPCTPWLFLEFEGEKEKGFQATTPASDHFRPRPWHSALPSPVSLRVGDLVSSCPLPLSQPPLRAACPRLLAEVSGSGLSPEVSPTAPSQPFDIDGLPSDLLLREPRSLPFGRPLGVLRVFPCALRPVPRSALRRHPGVEVSLAFSLNPAPCGFPVRCPGVPRSSRPRLLRNKDQPALLTRLLRPTHRYAERFATSSPTSPRVSFAFPPCGLPAALARPCGISPRLLPAHC